MTKVISRILGIERNSGTAGRNSLEFVNIARKGLHKKNLLSLARIMDISLKEISRLLPVSERTIQRYNSAQLLDKKTSEQILEIAQLYSFGFKIFGDPELFRKWMESSNSALGNIKPIELLDTSFGISLLHDELGRIQHGIFA